MKMDALLPTAGDPRSQTQTTTPLERQKVKGGDGASVFPPAESYGVLAMVFPGPTQAARIASNIYSIVAFQIVSQPFDPLLCGFD